MSALTAVVWYGPLCAYDCLTGQVEIFWVGYDWHDGEFCTRYGAVGVRAIWLLAVKMMLCCLMSSLQRRRPSTCNLYPRCTTRWSTMGRGHGTQGEVTGSIAGYLLSRGCKCGDTGARHGAHHDRVLDPGKEGCAYHFCTLRRPMYTSTMTTP